MSEQQKLSCLDLKTNDGSKKKIVNKLVESGKRTKAEAIIQRLDEKLTYKEEMDFHKPFRYEKRSD